MLLGDLPYMRLALVKRRRGVFCYISIQYTAKGVEYIL